jgi:hypothetical protein
MNLKRSTRDSGGKGSTEGKIRIGTQGSYDSDATDSSSGAGAGVLPRA